jgi:hypothetical protein
MFTCERAGPVPALFLPEPAAKSGPAGMSKKLEIIFQFNKRSLSKL